MAHILDAAQAAAHADRDVHIIDGFAHDIAQIVAIVQTCHNVDVKQFINALLVIFFGELVRVAQFAQPFQLDAFDQVGVLDIQSGDQADFLTHRITPLAATVMLLCHVPAYISWCVPLGSPHNTSLSPSYGV